MFSYEFQKQLVVLTGATFIYLVVGYVLMDIAASSAKAVSKFGKNVVARLKAKGYFK